MACRGPRRGKERRGDPPWSPLHPHDEVLKPSARRANHGLFVARHPLPVQSPITVADPPTPPHVGFLSGVPEHDVRHPSGTAAASGHTLQKPLERRKSGSTLHPCSSMPWETFFRSPEPDLAQEGAHTVPRVLRPGVATTSFRGRPGVGSTHRPFMFLNPCPSSGSVATRRASWPDGQTARRPPPSCLWPRGPWPSSDRSGQQARPGNAALWLEEMACWVEGRAIVVEETVPVVGALHLAAIAPRPVAEGTAWAAPTPQMHGLAALRVRVRPGRHCFDSSQFVSWWAEGKPSRRLGRLRTGRACPVSLLDLQGRLL